MLASLTSYVTKTVNPHTEITQQAQYSVNSIPFDISENYKLFESKYELHKVRLPGGDEWRYYDTGNGNGIASQIPLVMIPGTTGTAQVFFQQLVSLGLRGYRVLSVTIPTTSTVELFIKSLSQFLTYLNIDELHLLGTSLGGYLALSFTAQHPSRIVSLILTNSFINTRLFQANAPWISIHQYSEIMPEFYLRRYITQALPTDSPSLCTALATDFVLKQVNSLSRDELSARLSLNFSKHSINKLNYPQSAITIIDVHDKTALDQGMKDQLYVLLNQAKYSLMKHGGDFPYLSNYEEYTMLIQVHLRRKRCSIKTITKQKENELITKEDDIGVFDHRRQYHNAHKASLFRDEDGDQKDGVILQNYGSDSSQSSDMMMDLHRHTEHDKRKSHLMSNKSYEPRIVGVDQKQVDVDVEVDVDVNVRVNIGMKMNVEMDHTQYYTIGEDKKKQYLMDKKLKQKRYKEYLARKKKAYKRYLAHKNKDSEDKPVIAKKRKKKKKHSKKQHKPHSNKKRKRKKKKKQSSRKIKRKSNMQSVERRKAKMMEYYHEKKMKIMEFEEEEEHQYAYEYEDEDEAPPEPSPVPIDNSFEHNLSLAPAEIMHLGKDNLDIVAVGSNLISPRHSITEEDNENDPDNVNAEVEVDVLIASQLEASPDTEPEPQVEPKPQPQEPPSEQKVKDVSQNAFDPSKATRVSKHRVLRAKHRGMMDADDDDFDQTPMDLIPTTVAGHRYIPSYDSTMSVNHMDEDAKQEVLLLDRIRSGSYVPWNPSERNRQDSILSELGDYDFRASEVVPYIAGIEGDHIHDAAANLNGYTPISADHYSSPPLHNKFPSNASLYFVSKPTEENVLHGMVDEDDENVGDSIF
eukprot:1017567_1